MGVILSRVWVPGMGVIFRPSPRVWRCLLEFVRKFSGLFINIMTFELQPLHQIGGAVNESGLFLESRESHEERFSVLLRSLAADGVFCGPTNSLLLPSRPDVSGEKAGTCLNVSCILQRGKSLQELLSCTGKRR